MVGKGDAVSETTSVYRQALDRLVDYVESRHYAGYDKFDGLLSPLVWALFGHTYVTRLLATQAINRIPGLRPLVFMPKKRNPKGIANFVRAYARIPGKEEKVRELADWLLEHDSKAYHRYDGPGRAWGYQFPWQSPGFFQPAHAPNCIVTVFCAEAMLDAYRTLGQDKYREAAVDASRYLLEYLPVLESSADRLCMGYVKGDLSWKVVNINAVVAGYISRLHAVTKDPAHAEAARRMIAWVMEARDPAHSLWNYTIPASQSGIGPDNYHTGGILDGVFDAGAGEDYWSSLRIYRDRFFTSDGAPRWRLDRDRPFDVHGAAQAILTFVAASRIRGEYLADAKRVADWTLANLRDARSGRFYYQRFRFFTWKIDLMRWNNSWMMRALAELSSRIDEGGAK